MIWTIFWFRDMQPCGVADLDLGLGLWNEYNLSHTHPWDECVFSYIWSIVNCSFWFPEKRWDQWYIITQLAGKMPLIYCQLDPIGWLHVLHATYHLLREPGNSIDLVVFYIICFMVNVMSSYRVSRKETLPPLSLLIQVGVAMGQRGTEVAKALGVWHLWCHAVI